MADPARVELDSETLADLARQAASSPLPYWAHQHAPESALPADDPRPRRRPSTCSAAKSFRFLSRLANSLNVTSTSPRAEHDRGGHFQAVAEPQLLATRLRDAFRPFRP